MPWFVFAIATPTFYSVVNFLEKYLLEKKIQDPLALAAIAGLISGLFGLTLGLITGFKYIGLDSIVLLLFAGLLQVFYTIPYYIALNSDDTSRVVPLMQFVPVFTLILSVLFLNESMAIKQIVGLSIVVITGIFLSSDKIEGQIFRPRKAFWFMLLAALMFGSSSILFRFVSKESSYWINLSYQFMGMGIGSLILISIPKLRRKIIAQTTLLKPVFGLVAIVNGIVILAQMTEAYAVTLVSVPYVNLIGSIQPIILLIFGFTLTKWFPKIIKEDISKTMIYKKIVSMILILVGFYLVYF
ncbi:MAG: EamA family transporter [Candidatus Amesbacteria bacterium]|nr:EamA family transporter [Candidatus Amesbacteria bacterium]